MPARLSSPIRGLGVLSGGSDVPGINAAIKALVYRTRDNDMSVLGIRGGWEGLTFLDRSLGRDRLIFRFDEPETWQQGYIMPLTRLSTRTMIVWAARYCNRHIPTLPISKSATCRPISPLMGKDASRKSAWI